MKYPFLQIYCQCCYFYVHFSPLLFNVVRRKLFFFFLLSPTQILKNIKWIFLNPTEKLSSSTQLFCIFESLLCVLCCQWHWALEHMFHNCLRTVFCASKKKYIQNKTKKIFMKTDKRAGCVVDGVWCKWCDDIMFAY